MENIINFLEKAFAIECNLLHNDDDDFNINKLERTCINNITNKLLSMNKETRSIYALRMIKAIDMRGFGPIEAYERDLYSALGELFLDFEISLENMKSKIIKSRPYFCEGIHFNSPECQAEENRGVNNKGFTIKRQVRAICELMESAGVSHDIDKTAIAEFIQFITGRETGSKKISNTNIYKEIKLIKGAGWQPETPKEIESYCNDIDFVADGLEKIGLIERANKIRTEKKM
jgi:hypothetical protein